MHGVSNIFLCIFYILETNFCHKSNQLLVETANETRSCIALNIVHWFARYVNSKLAINTWASKVFNGKQKKCDCSGCKWSGRSVAAQMIKLQKF